ncbi:hypothetical protein [Chitinophaga varians]|uniref:hypothetical protein n=1 Tax=Chitinophaga varians TaxID=2202339 RepID=UPI00165FB081|nr:hypothetical protein [Chitinophaga varians]MBC9913374.1 hypothetical protein [Chitinophaga varians]
MATRYSPADSLKRMVNVSVNNYPSLKGIWLWTPVIFRDTLYVCGPEKMLMIDLKKGTVGTNSKVNAALAPLWARRLMNAQVVPTEEGFYYACSDGVRLIARDGRLLLYHKTPHPVIFVNVNDHAVIAHCLREVVSIDRISLQVHVLKTNDDLATTMGAYLSYKDGICRDELTFMAEFTTDTTGALVRRDIDLNGFNKKEDAYFLYANKEFYVYYDMEKRDVLYFVNKQNLNVPFKKIDIRKYNFKPTTAQREKEEDNPGLKLTYYNDAFYLVSWKQGQLQVFTF